MHNELSTQQARIMYKHKVNRSNNVGKTEKFQGQDITRPQSQYKCQTDDSNPLQLDVEPVSRVLPIPLFSRGIWIVLVQQCL